ncbi:MAG: universal stress protein UspA [Ramlibacter sp.]|jgi:nucleotide-binding universal stress UspA family protein|nr:universal stress protein UspA [Ramlibacter sp.]MDB5913546.1 universal stress protein UspA [Ramlibacter sp.]
MSIRSILAVSDLSAPEHVAVERACHLAHAHKATLKLMYVPAPGQEPSAAAPVRLARLARQLEERLGSAVETVSGKSVTLDDVADAAKGIDLVVLPHRRERSTAAFFRGQPVVRLLRRSSTPVLVVRRNERPHYARILVAVDFTPASRSVVQSAAAFAPDAQLQLFHAVDTRGEAKLRSAEATEHALRAYRAKCQRQAEANMLSLANSFAARRNRVFATLGRGDPGTQVVVQQEHSGADLVVVGKKRTSAWEDFLCASVAHRVLSWGSSDVLVIPEAHVAATASIAAKRLRLAHLPATPTPWRTRR